MNKIIDSWDMVSEAVGLGKVSDVFLPNNYQMPKDKSFAEQMYNKTGEKKWVWIAYKNGKDVDYQPGIDDGEQPEKSNY